MPNRVDQPAFRAGGSTVNLSVTGSTGNVQVQSANLSPHVRIFNSGSVVAFVKAGADNTVTASATADMPIAPGTVEIIACPHPYIAAIGASAGPAVLYFTPGEGI